MTESAGASKQTLSNISELHIYDVLLFVAGTPCQTFLCQTQQLTPKGSWVAGQAVWQTGSQKQESVLFILLSGLSVYMLKYISISALS